MERETLEVDVLIVGGGPAGLAAACRLGQLAKEQEQEISVCLVEKGSEIGAHILSGAVFETTALGELFPDWQQEGAPLHTPVSRDQILFLTGPARHLPVPALLAPRTMHNRGNYIISLGNLCRWLAEQAEKLGIDIFPGFAAQEVLYGEDGAVTGVRTGDMGAAADGGQRGGFSPGMDIRAGCTLFAEGCRGHLGKELMQRFQLDEGRDPQHYGIGIKEIWRVAAEGHEPGLVVHTTGWPLREHGALGGGFLYHAEERQVSLGLITDLNYTNPHLDPYEEFQRFKCHPAIRKHLEGGERLSYGARAIAKGGPQSLPKMNFPGGLLIGCDAGTLNYAKIKGSHTAMKSGMVAAETAFAAILAGSPGDTSAQDDKFWQSWAGRELHQQRNFGPAQHRWGNLLGSAYAFLDLNLLGGRAPWTLRDPKADHEQMKSAAECPRPNYPKADGMLSFDRMSSVFLSNTNHEENQPCHLLLKDEALPIASNLPRYDEPAQRYCPAGVYEVVQEEGGKQRFQINAQNCVHCKTCDIKDPAANITWVPPEGGGGPNYPNM